MQAPGAEPIDLAEARPVDVGDPGEAERCDSPPASSALVTRWSIAPFKPLPCMRAATE